MKSHKEYKNEYQHWLDEIQALNKAVQHDAKKWKIVGCFFALCASLSFCGSFFAAYFICEIATITNLTLSVGVTILGFCFWLVFIFYKVASKVFPKIPLINNDELGHYGCFDFRDEWVYKYIDVFKQFDEKRIVIDASNHDKVGVFLTYFDKVKYLLTGLLRSESDAEELAQDIFVKLWINRQSIDPSKAFNTYIYTIARNTALNYLKHKLVEDNFLNSLNDFDVEEADSSDEILFAKEISLLVEMTVCRMPVQRRKIYQMSREKGISNNEIAEELGISKKTVENQISLALQEIKRVISAFLIFFV